ncbi:MAG TPA: 2-oxoglutarate dehydrogenase, E2 component, dihydrolipoamide succinyltransferase [Terriglobales bacterium]|nr:2-oxoglutarate dehydrogenase, E2 component, dihydrolipoamide succinyltransferase [Terriglobales bacterium]
MATDVVMPQMGESIFEGTITKWLKKPGENVQRDEPLFEISTDKVDAEIPAPASGVLREIKVGEGQTVQVNTIVGVIDANGASSGVSKSTPTPTPAVSSPEAGLEPRASASPVRNAGATRVTAATDGPGVQKTPPVAQKAPAPATPRAQEQGDGQPGERPSAIPQPQVSAQGAATAGAVEVKMPQMGESIFEGTITKWLKQPGDQVRRDEPLFEISTDKVDAEIPAPASGALAEIRAQAGETVQVNSVVAVISAAGAVPAAQPKPAQVSAATPQPTPSAPAAARDLEVQPQRTQIYREVRDAERVRSSPLVRRLAKEHAVDLTKVPGTGQGGRITKEDIENYIAQPAGPSATGRRPSAEAPRPMAAPVTPLAQGALEIPGDLVPMTPMRRKIAERMVESKRISPHVHTIYEVDMTRVASLRTKVRAAWEQRNGTKLTFMPFVARATCAALRKYPIVNSSVEGDAIRYRRSINLGIAVALDWGLIVPVIRNAEEKNFLGLARAINDLSERARTKRLNPDDVLNGTFTITNPGSIGGLIGLPIIMQPQVAILGTGGIKKQPVVVTDEDGADSISIRSIMHIVLGYDHRIIDGAIAGYFLGFLKKFLEEWAEEIG